MKLTFTPRTAPGHTREPIAYSTCIFICGTTVHKLALHKDQFGYWSLSDPASGYKIMDVVGAYKMAMVSSKGYTLAEARDAAKFRLHALCERIGADKFNATLEKASCI